MKTVERDTTILEAGTGNSPNPLSDDDDDDDVQTDIFRDQGYFKIY
jgi:hypothetical protein